MPKIKLNSYESGRLRTVLKVLRADTGGAAFTLDRPDAMFLKRLLESANLADDFEDEPNPHDLVRGEVARLGDRLAKVEATLAALKDPEPQGENVHIRGAQMHRHAVGDVPPGLSRWSPFRPLASAGHTRRGAVPLVRGKSKMTREEAVQTLRNCNVCVIRHSWSEEVCLDGWFTADQVEALSMAMRDSSIFKDAYP